jgi:hypothetical protein
LVAPNDEAGIAADLSAATDHHLRDLARQALRP